jgi:hypothetical protein
MTEVLTVSYVAGMVGGLLAGVPIGALSVLVWAFTRRQKRRREWADLVREGNNEVDRWLEEIEREKASSSSASSG